MINKGIQMSIDCAAMENFFFIITCGSNAINQISNFISQLSWNFPFNSWSGIQQESTSFNISLAHKFSMPLFNEYPLKGIQK